MPVSKIATLTSWPLKPLLHSCCALYLHTEYISTKIKNWPLKKKNESLAPQLLRVVPT